MSIARASCAASAKPTGSACAAFARVVSARRRPSPDSVRLGVGLDQQRLLITQRETPLWSCRMQSSSTKPLHCRPSPRRQGADAAGRISVRARHDRIGCGAGRACGIWKWPKALVLWFFVPAELHLRAATHREIRQSRRVSVSSLSSADRDPARARFVFAEPFRTASTRGSGRGVASTFGHCSAP